MASRVFSRPNYGWVEWIKGNRSHLRGQLRATVTDPNPAKHPLVYETKVIWGIQLKQHPKMALGWDVCLLHEQLTAHPQVRHQGISCIEWEPEIFASPSGRGDLDAGQPISEITDTREVSTYGTRMEHINSGDRVADNMVIQATTNYFDFGKLRHRQL